MRGKISWKTKWSQEFFQPQAVLLYHVHLGKTRFVWNPASSFLSQPYRWYSLVQTGLWSLDKEAYLHHYQRLRLSCTRVGSAPYLKRPRRKTACCFSSIRRFLTDTTCILAFVRLLSSGLSYGLRVIDRPRPCTAKASGADLETQRQSCTGVESSKKTREWMKCGAPDVGEWWPVGSSPSSRGCACDVASTGLGALPRGTGAAGKSLTLHFFFSSQTQVARDQPPPVLLVIKQKRSRVILLVIV